MNFRTMLPIVVAVFGLTACAVPGSTPIKKEFFIHSAWTKGIFSEAATVTGIGNAKFIYLAGVGAEDENGPRGNIRHHGDFTAQCRYAYDKIKRVLAAHGAKLGDTVKVTTYLTDIRNRIDSGRCLSEQFASAGAELPTQTMVQISALAFPEMMIEVDVTAVAQMP